MLRPDCVCAMFTGGTGGSDGKLARRLDVQFEAASNVVVGNQTSCRAPALTSTHGSGIGRGSKDSTSVCRLHCCGLTCNAMPATSSKCRGMQCILQSVVWFVDSLHII